MARVVLSRQARQDIEELWLRIATQDIVAADAVLGRIERRIASLADHPELAPVRPDIAVDARALVIERWLALYRIEQNEVQVGRVVDGARDLSRIVMPKPR